MRPVDLLSFLKDYFSDTKVINDENDSKVRTNNNQSFYPTYKNLKQDRDTFYDIFYSQDLEQPKNLKKILTADLEPIDNNKNTLSKIDKIEKPKNKHKHIRRKTLTEFTQNLTNTNALEKAFEEKVNKLQDVINSVVKRLIARSKFYPRSKCYLGIALRGEIGISRNDEKGKKLIKEAADSGDELAIKQFKIIKEKENISINKMDLIINALKNKTILKQKKGFFPNFIELSKCNLSDTSLFKSSIDTSKDGDKKVIAFQDPNEEHNLSTSNNFETNEIKIKNEGTKNESQMQKESRFEIESICEMDNNDAFKLGSYLNQALGEKIFNKTEEEIEIERLKNSLTKEKNIKKIKNKKGESNSKNNQIEKVNANNKNSKVCRIM